MRATLAAIAIAAGLTGGASAQTVYIEEPAPAYVVAPTYADETKLETRREEGTIGNSEITPLGAFDRIDQGQEE